MKIISAEIGSLRMISDGIMSDLGEDDSSIIKKFIY